VERRDSIHLRMISGEKKHQDHRKNNSCALQPLKGEKVAERRIKRGEKEKLARRPVHLAGGACWGANTECFLYLN